MTELQAYLDRIGFAGRPRADLASLKVLIRAHVFAIPFENIDVQLGRPVSLEIAPIFDKLVARRRGGWCYEQNGLFGWALGEIGFDVTRMAGGVLRERMGDFALGNHLCLKVRLERDYLADVGFGGSLTAPLPIEIGAHLDPPFRITLQEVGDEYWRFTEDAGDGPFSFDFRVAPADQKLLGEKCAFLQTNPASPFVQNLVAQRRFPDRHATLRGRVLSSVGPGCGSGGSQSHIIQSTDELLSRLSADFSIDVPEVAGLWPKICERHKKVMAEKAARANA